MIYNFCTLFDKNYLYRGLALYQSLKKQCSSFKIWILCMDEITYSLLKRLNLENACLIKLGDFEDNELLKIKSGRTAAEYCWTLTPSLPLYIFKNYKINDVAYLDADLFFFSSPEPIYREFIDKSILIVKHNFSKKNAYKIKFAGIYNVELVWFKNDKIGLECLSWWRERCLEWCYNRFEDGKLGDQLYLNDWPTRFKNVQVLQHLGGGVAPWNIDNYELIRKNNNLYVDNQILIFYHFQALKINNENKYQPAIGYVFSEKVINLIYCPYWLILRKSISQIKKVEPKFNYGFVAGFASFYWIILIKNILKKMNLFK